MIDDGVIKFNFELSETTDSYLETYRELEKWRSTLFTLKYIGEYPSEEVGYGNISARVQQNEFLVSATQTGKYPTLKENQYSYVHNCQLETMTVLARGEYPPSSESLTHYAIYEACPQVQFIFHIHDSELWKFMLEHNMESTSAHVSYGTLDMAKEAKLCIGDKQSGIFAMQGHQDGIISYAKSSESCGDNILKLRKLYLESK